MKLFIVEDNSSFRESLKTFLEGFLLHEVVGEAANGKEFIDNYNDDADIILMDINMPELDGVKATKLGTFQNRNAKIIAVTQHRTIVDLHRLISAGFKGFVSKTNLFMELPKALKKVANDELYFPDELEITNRDKPE